MVKPLVCFWGLGLGLWIARLMVQESRESLPVLQCLRLAKRCTLRASCKLASNLRICIQDLNQQQVDKVYLRMVEHLDESLSQAQGTVRFAGLWSPRNRTGASHLQRACPSTSTKVRQGECVTSSPATCLATPPPPPPSR